MKLCRRAPRLQRGRSGFDSHHLHPAVGLGGSTTQPQAVRKERMSTSTHDDTAGASLAMTWELDADYITFARFMRAVVDRGLEHDSSTSWATERMSLEGLFHLALCTHRERGERAALLDLHSVIGSDCLAHLRLARGRAYVTAAARSVDALAAARTWLRERFPDSKPHEKKEVQMSFWTNDRGGWRMSRSIAV